MLNLKGLAWEGEAMFDKILRRFQPSKRSGAGLPESIADWLNLIERARLEGRLSAHAEKLVKAHDLSPKAHAVNAFAADIMLRARERLTAMSTNADANLDSVIDELVKWKTALQCGHTHDVSKGYFHDAEHFIDLQWHQIIMPLIRELDFTTVLDLACGHGRNTEFLRRLTKEIHVIDINRSCIEACRERFGEMLEGTRFHYHVTDGNHLRMIADGSISLVYTWDSMVHFDKLIVRDYVAEIARVLRSGGSAFLHHSNYGAVSPDSDWASNPGTRSDMSAELMGDYAIACDLAVASQHIQGRAEGWGLDELDCVSILQKP
jgi:SAM-dependent methyltransferase